MYRWRPRTPKGFTIPPVIPYSIPYLGSTISFAYNGKVFIGASTARSGKQSPFALRIMNRNFFFVAGAENIQKLWKKSGGVSGSAVQIFCLRYLFAMPEAALKVYMADRSGISAATSQEGGAEPHNRIDYLTHIGMVKLLSGAGLPGYFQRWQAKFEDHLISMNIGQQWSEFKDFQTFWDNTFGLAVVEGFTGPLLRKINPDLVEDLRRYDDYIPELSAGLPRWMNRKAYAARDKLVDAIAEWHATARAQFTSSAIHTYGDTDPFWGTEFIRERQLIFENADNFDYKAYAASDLGFIWGSVTNLVPSSMWEIFETYTDSSLLSRVRSELEATFGGDPCAQIAYDGTKFKQLHVMQAIYAETLRLRVYAYAARYTADVELRINQWLIPKNSVMLVSTAPAHMDETFWKSGDNCNSQGVEEFSPERFLKRVEKSGAELCDKSGKEKSTKESAGFVFSTAGTNGSWIPYGGGPRACPGQQFAKRAMMTSLAVLASRYDVEFLVRRDSPALRLDPRNYGWGGQRPVGEMPFRIRLRVGNVKPPL